MNLSNYIRIRETKRPRTDKDVEMHDDDFAVTLDDKLTIDELRKAYKHMIV